MRDTLVFRCTVRTVLRLCRCPARVCGGQLAEEQMETEENAPGILLVGAYERENFGDLLFLLQTETYLKGFSTRATAPFPGQMLDLLGKNVIDYASAVAKFPCEPVWVVGGEVGGTSLPSAFRMSASQGQYSEHLELDPKGQRAELERTTRLSVSASPYMPRMSAFPETHGSTLVINSVGLSGMRNLLGDRRDETWGAVREAGFVSVRDKDSSVLLKRHSIGHVLAPDLVHTMTLSGSVLGKRESDLALVQVKGPVLAQYGSEKFAKRLAQAAALKTFRIRLFTAGSARGHDDLDLYEEVVREFRKLAPSRSIDISQTRLPMEKAREIANCGLWVGTSLHGLIISSAFDVPRVGLELDKLVKYATSWDEPMPVGVPIDEMNAAVEVALAESHSSMASGRSRELAHLADESITAAIGVLDGDADASALRLSRERLAERVARRRSRPWRAIHRKLRPLG